MAIGCSSICTGEGHCRGTFADLTSLRLSKNTTFVLVPDSGQCSDDPFSAVSANRTAELHFRFPNVHLEIVSECHRHRLVKQSSQLLNVGSFPCTILKLHQGNVKISGITFDNAECGRRHGLRGHVQQAAVLIRASRYFEKAAFVDIGFITARPFDTGDAKEDVNEEQSAIGIHVAPVGSESFLYLDDVTFSDFKHGGIKFDLCAGNVSAENVPLLEVFQNGGIFNATGTNFTMFDVNAVVTDVVLTRCSRISSTLSGSVSAYGSSSSSSSVMYVVVSLVAILIVSVSIEYFQNVNGRCMGPSAQRHARYHESYDDSMREDHLTLRPLLSSSPSTSAAASIN